MIIRPVCSREFVSLPNVILNDDRLSIETRGMIAYILSKPKGWQIRTVPLARALSKKGTRLGRTKLGRMLREAHHAGYLARSAEQARKTNGDFDSYVYIVGVPEDVAAALGSVAETTGLAFGSPDCDIFGARTFCAAQGAQTQNVHRIDKRQNLEITEFRKSLPQPLPEHAEAAQAAEEDGCTALGRSALANGMRFVFEESEPFIAWRAFRGADGMPLIDVRIVDGRRRRGSWFPALYPPTHTKEERS